MNLQIANQNNAPEIVSKPFEWKVGIGCSVLRYSDIDAAHVIEVKKSATGEVYEVTVQLDDVKLLNGFNSGEPDALVCHEGGFMGHTTGKQRYEMKANPNGSKITFTMRRDGNWARKGQPMQRVMRGYRLSPVHQHFYDYNF